MDFIYIELFTRIIQFDIQFLDILFVLMGIIPYSGFTGLNNILYVYLYIVL